MSDEVLTLAKVKEIVEKALSGMPEDLAARARRYLVEPYRSDRVWGYGPETFQCWVVLVDDKKSSGTGIGFCKEGVWQPDRKWVLLWVEIREPRDADLGQDSGWFTSLEEAFGESFMANDQV